MILEMKEAKEITYNSTKNDQEWICIKNAQVNMIIVISIVFSFQFIIVSGGGIIQSS